MRRWFWTALLALFAAPVAAQMGGADSEKFLTAVKEQDGATANSLVQANPGIVNLRGYNGDTALILATRQRSSDWMRFLIGRGAQLGLADRNGDTALIVACRLGYGEGAALLLARGARVDDVNRRGETALIAAVQARQPAIVRALLEAGADPRRADFVAGLSAADYARRDTRTPELARLIATVQKKRAVAGPVR